MNHKIISFLGIAILSSIAISMNTANLTAEQILKKAEQNILSETVEAELSITITRPKWTKTMELKTWAMGTDYAMAYVTAPVKDSGTVYLKSKNEVYNYLPNIKKTVKLPANLLSQNWMGTDLSTDDLVKLSKLTKEYDALLAGSATLSGRDCYVIVLVPKSTAMVLWGKLILAIDKKDFVQTKTLFYDEDLELVNTIVGSEIKSFGSKKVATKLVVTPASKKSQSTTLIYKTLYFDRPMDESFFTKTNMPKVTP